METFFNLFCSRKYAIRSYECDLNGFLRTMTFMNILQDAAEDHIRKLGIGPEKCSKKGVLWVTTKYNIEIISPPKAGEKIEVITWISSANPTTAIREFIILNPKKEIIVRASSKWALLSLKTRRPVKIVEHFSNELPVCPRELLCTKLLNLKVMTREDIVKDSPVNYEYIDFNKHVGNGMYPFWASAAMDDEFRRNHYPISIKISFKSEALFGEGVETISQLDDLSSVHTIKSKKDGRLLATVWIEWVRNPDVS